MKLYFERFPEDSWAFQDAERRWLSPDDPVDTDVYTGVVEATITNPVTGESIQYTVEKEYEDTDCFGEASCRRQFEKDAEELVWDALAEDSVFSDLDDDEWYGLQIEIDNIEFEPNFNEAVQPMKKNLITEADENIIEQVEQLIDSIIEKNLETANLPQLVERSVSGYDSSWAQKNVDLDAQYKVVKQQFVSEVAKSLFANFDKQ